MFRVIEKSKAPKTYLRLACNATVIRGKSLDDVYKRPSKTKRQIFERWLKWFNENGIHDVWICAYNDNTFSLAAIDEDENIYYITKSKQYFLMDKVPDFLTEEEPCYII